MQNNINAFQGTLLFPFERTFSIEKTSNTTGDFKLTNSFTLPLHIEAQITGLYYSKRNIPQGEELARSSVDLGLKKSLWNKKGEITLAVSDLFNNFGLRQRIKDKAFSALYENYYETQIVRLGMKYKF